MISNPQFVLVGRMEVATETAERFVVERLSFELGRAHDLMRAKVIEKGGTWWGARAGEAEREKLSDEERFWLDWNVAACVGVWGRWTTFSLMHLPELGIHPAPAVKSQWAFTAGAGRMERVDVETGPRAPMVHQTTKLLSPARWAIPGVNEIYAMRAYEGLLTAERYLEAMSIFIRPDTQTVGGLQRMLEREGIRIVLPKAEGGAHAKFRTYILEQRPVPGQVSLRGLGVTDPEDELRSPDAARQWLNLNEALEERV
jgi:hypothetical protein